MAVKSYALTTASRASSYMDITTPTGAKLIAMENMINAVTDFIENYIRMRVKKTAYTNELYNTEDANTLNLKHFPIISTEDFTLQRRESSQNEDDWGIVASKYYHIDYDAGIIFGAGGTLFSRTNMGYRVTYTAGYDFDNTATFLSDTEAGDIELASWMLVSGLWNQRKGGVGIKSEKIGDYAITYTKSLMEDENIKAILDKYTVNTELGVITPYQY